jgi:DsbC/DsbD-like thiol-disulfide interchange protein
MAAMLKPAVFVVSMSLWMVPAGQQAGLPREPVSHELPQHETAHLTIATSVTPASVSPGQKVTLNVDVTPKPKIHVYAPGQEGYIPIALSIDADPAVMPAKAKYPAGEKLLMKALNETQIVYAKPFRITQELKLSESGDLARRATDGGSLTIKGSVRYQACDDKICFLPTTVPVEWSITLAPVR